MSEWQIGDRSPVGRRGGTMPVGEWLLGYAAGKLGDKILKAFDRDPLVRDLEGAIDKWRRDLPDDARLEATAALFPSIKVEGDLQVRPALKTLRKEMAGSRVPSCDMWKAALLEQWWLVKNTIPDTQLFFKLDEKVAQDYLDKLAQQLVDVCAQREELFGPTVLALLLELRFQVEDLKVRTPVEFAEKSLPLTALAIEWTKLMHTILPLRRKAESENRDWPGENAQFTDDEFRHYRLLTSLVTAIDGSNSAVLMAIDALRWIDNIGFEWHQRRDELIDLISRVESADKPSRS